MGRLAELIARADKTDSERIELQNLVEQLEGLLATVDNVDSSGQTTFPGPTKHYREAVFHTNAFDQNSRKRGIRIFNPANSDIVGFAGMRDNAEGDLIIGVNDLTAGEDTSIAFSDGSGGTIVLRAQDSAVAQFRGTSTNGSDFNMWDDSGNNMVAFDSAPAGVDGQYFFRQPSDGSILLSIKGGSETVFNQAGLDQDFRVEGDTKTNLLKVDAGNEQVSVGGFFNLAAGGELTIASGAITVTQSYHSIDTESDASSDNLDTINGGADGDILVIKAANSARTIVVKDGTGNILSNGDHSLDNVADRMVLISDGTNWHQTGFGNNAA